MSERGNPRVYLLECRQRDHLSGKWHKWYVRADHFTNYRRAKHERDVITGDDREFQCRIVTFNRGRVYHDSPTEETT